MRKLVLIAILLYAYPLKAQLYINPGVDTLGNDVKTAIGKVIGHIDGFKFPYLFEIYDAPNQAVCSFSIEIMVAWIPVSDVSKFSSFPVFSVYFYRADKERFSCRVKTDVVIGNT